MSEEGVKLWMLVMGEAGLVNKHCSWHSQLCTRDCVQFVRYDNYRGSRAHRPTLLSERAPCAHVH